MGWVISQAKQLMPHVDRAGTSLLKNLISVGRQDDGTTLPNTGSSRSLVARVGRLVSGTLSSFIARSPCNALHRKLCSPVTWDQTVYRTSYVPDVCYVPTYMHGLAGIERDK